MRVDKNQVLCIFLGISLAVLSRLVDNLNSPLRDGVSLTRNSYGQGEMEREILVEGILETPVPLQLALRERRYDEKSAEMAMERAAQGLAERILGENASLQEVRTQLVLPLWLEEYGISVEWKSGNPELLEQDGTVHSQRADPLGTQTELVARLSAGEFEEEYVFTVNILPPEQTEEEKRLEAFRSLLRKMDEGQSTSESLVLPEEYEGRRLRYRLPRENTFLLFPCLGFLAAVLLPLREKQKEKERQRRRERQMMTDYPDIVSKLVVYSGAGLPIRRAWERIVHEYEEKGERREAYEEMASAYHMMERGVPELRAYMEFGNRCRFLPYRKLAGLLEQNIRNGSESLRLVLESEMESAFEQQKNLARRMGEEASTKLLMPLMMMLLIVMVMVTVPAFLAFGIG